MTQQQFTCNPIRVFPLLLRVHVVRCDASCVIVFVILSPFAALALCKYPMADQVTESPANATVSDCPQRHDGDNCTGRSQAVVSPVVGVVNDDLMRQTAMVKANIGTNQSTQWKEIDVCFPMTQIKWAWLCDVSFFSIFFNHCGAKRNPSALWSLCSKTACGEKVPPMCPFVSVSHYSWPTFFFEWHLNL